MRCPSSGYRSDTELVGKTSHHGILCRANQPRFSSFLETKNVYEKGTDETRNFLVNECSLIYECNVCRNMFRSLSGFIKHKRLYCFMLINRLNSSTGNHFQDGCQSNRKQTCRDNGEHFGDIIMRVLKDEQKSKFGLNPAVNLEMRTSRVQESAKSVSQQKPNCRPVGLNKRKSTAVELGHLSTTEAQLKDPLGIKSVCDLCEKAFETVKSLKLHKYKKHGTSIRCMKRMRDKVQKQRAFKEKLLKKSLAKPELHNIRRYDPENGNDSTCCYCQKSFQRKAVLITHQNRCSFKTLCSNNKDKSEESKKSQLQEALEREETNLPQDLKENLTNRPNEPNDWSEKQNPENSFTNSDRSCALRSEFGSQDSLFLEKNNQKLKPSYLPCLCKICKKHFNALSNLRRHIYMFHYRSRKFGCKLCEYRAYRKFDVINHLGHIHSVTGEKETMTVDYITVHEQQISKEDIDDVVVLISDEEKRVSIKKMEPNLLEQVLPPSTNESEAASVFEMKGNTPFIISACVQKSIPTERSKLKRSMSKHSMDTRKSTFKSLDTKHKRPKRNRVTPVEKDFVYDLSTIIKGDVAYPESASDINGRVTADLAKNTPVESVNESKQQMFSETRSYSTKLVKGALQRMALLCVHQGRAAYASLPPLPTQRPPVRMRQATVHRADLTTVPVIETTDLEEARLKAKILDDRLLENLSKSTGNEFKLKPSLVLQQSTINSLLKKVDDLSLQNRKKIQTGESEAGIPKLLINEEIPVENIAEEATYSKLRSVHKKPKNQPELLECLVKNEAENNGSHLLQFAVEN